MVEFYSYMMKTVWPIFRHDIAILTKHSIKFHTVVQRHYLCKVENI